MLLELLELKGGIVTMGVMGTQRAIAQVCVDKSADYILALKGNQGTLEDEVKLLCSKPIPPHLAGQARRCAKRRLSQGMVEWKSAPTDRWSWGEGACWRVKARPL
jgi:hypothetical protein